MIAPVRTSGYNCILEITNSTLECDNVSYGNYPMFFGEGASTCSPHPIIHCEAATASLSASHPQIPRRFSLSCRNVMTVPMLYPDTTLSVVHSVARMPQRRGCGGQDGPGGEGQTPLPLCPLAR